MSHRKYVLATGRLIGLQAVIALAQTEVAPDVSIISPADGIATAQGEVQVNVAFRANANSAEGGGPTGNVISVVLLLNGRPDWCGWHGRSLSGTDTRLGRTV